MKAKQSMRRLAALTLATAVIIPQAEPAIAASLRWGTAGITSLSTGKLSTGAINGTESGRYPLLTLPRSFRQKISASIPVVESRMETSYGLPPSETGKVDGGAATSDEMTTETAGDRIFPMTVMKAETRTGDQTTEINMEQQPAAPTLEEALEGENPPGETEGKTAGEEILKTLETEEITDVTEPSENRDGEDMSGDVVMPPEARDPASEGDGEQGDPETGEIADGTQDAPGESPSEEPADGETVPTESGEPESPETPVLQGPEQEESPAMEQAELLQVSPFAAAASPHNQLYNYVIGYGVPLVTDDSLYSQFKYSRPVELGGLFQVELENVVTGTVEDYGSRFCSPSRGSVPSVMKPYYLYTDSDKNNFSYCIFPTEAMLGRVPDRTFAGWYIYPYGAKSNLENELGKKWADIGKSWAYGDSAVGEMVPIEPVPYDTSIVDTDKQSLGDTWDGMRKYDSLGYKDATENGGGIASTDPVSFVGRWVYSDESRAADVTRVKTADGGEMETPVTITAKGQALTLYSKEIVGIFGDQLKSLATDFDRGENGGKTEYWLRVGADVTSVDLEFNAAEIFYAYNSDKSGKSSPVQVTWDYGGETTLDYTAGNGGETSVFSSRMLPLYKVPSGIPEPSNSYDNPAYSQWSVTNIALRPSSPGGTGEGYRYNDITITVTPPSVYAKQLAGETLTAADKSKLTTYVFHIQRLTEPTLAQSSGNTPMGMIERDTSWASEEERQAAAEVFRNSLTFSSKYGEYPRDQENNGGAIFRQPYNQAAWNLSGENWQFYEYRENVDLDPKAIVVYQNSAFLDPGITLTDSEGREVSIRAGNRWEVVRRLKLKTAEQLTVENLSKGTWGWYKGGKLEAETAGEILSGSRDQIDLRGLKVLPGIYEIEYELVDPVAGKTYGSDSGSFVTAAGQAGASHFRRTLVILPVPGDVDMDGAVTSADAEILRRSLQDATENASAMLGDVYLGTNASVDLFAYRVADVNHDAVVNNKVQNSNVVTDVDTLETLPRAQLKSVSETESKSDYYYIPLPSYVESPARQRLQVGSSSGKAQLQLVYLGKEKGRTVTEDYEDGYVNDPYGPWRAEGAWKTGEDSAEKMELFETMWVGVKLSDGDLSQLLQGKDVDTFTFSLVYDGRYLEPASVLTESELRTLGSGASAEQRWQTTLRLYNMGARSQTVWGNNYSYEFTGAAQSGRSFATYDSKVITPLEESALAEGRTSHLRELVFSITLNDNNNSAVKASLDRAGDQWILAVPFTLIQHPVGETSYQGVEMQAGMSDFTLLLNDASGNLVTAAYNPLVTDIFGGNTQNLANHVTYANAGPQVPLGQDNSKVYYIRSETKAGISSGAKDVVYSQYFEAQIGWQKNGDSYEYVHQIPSRAIMRRAPEWLHYDVEAGVISGIPEAAGTYYFTIAQYRYQLDVSPAPLHYWADSQSSYYGENEFRGDRSKDFTFRYDASDIQSIDRARAANSGGSIQNDGLGSSLEALLDDAQYRAPEFTAVDSNGEIVVSTTRVSNGAYSIRAATEADSNNYQMIYSPEMADGEKGLVILPRPLEIRQLLVNVDKVIYSDQDGVLPNLEATLSNSSGGKQEFSVKLVDPLPNDAAGHYDRLPLSDHDYLNGVLLPGDSLVLQYRAELLQTEQDKAEGGGLGGVRYVLREREETRLVQASGLKLIGGTNSDCYTIQEQQTPLVNGAEANVVGKVRRRNIIAFDIKQAPPLEYQVGDQLTQADALRFNIVKEGDGTNAVEGTYPYNEQTTFLQHGVRVTWATKEQMERGEEGDLEYHEMQTFDMRYDGRYLCLSTQIGIDENGNAETVKTCYTQQVLKITPRPLVLTAVESSRFYGEGNGTLRYTYDPRALSVADQERMRTLFGGSVDGGPRDGQELEQILGTRYTPPKLTVVDSVETRVKLDATSKYTGSTTNAVLITGAASEDYDILYTYASRDGTVTQEEWGASPYSIRKRYIVVEALTTTRDLATIYADAKRIYVSGLPLGVDEVALGLPQHTEDSVTYYPRYGASAPQVQSMGYAAGSSAIVNGDKVSFTYTATMVSQDGPDYVQWTNFAKGHFNMGTEKTKHYPVQVENLQLTGEDANNYELVYWDNPSATLGSPALLQTVTNCINPGVNANRNYYVSRVVTQASDGTLTETGQLSQGVVTLRPIEYIEFRSAGKVTYTYGDSYAPDQTETPGDQGLQIYIQYGTEYENYDGNVTNGLLDYKVSHYENGNPVTTFDERGLKIYYQKGTSEPLELSYRELLTIDLHDGAKLLVAGSRGEQTELKWSAPSQETLKVQPRVLTLRADDQHRVYGENNPALFSFTYNVSQLAPQDQAKLGKTGGWSDGGELAGLGLAYQAPVFGTRATQRSDVRSRGRAGYEISVSAGSGRQGSLANYRLEYEPGTLYIYPRLVQLSRFLKNPIYTIYSDMSDRIVYTNVFKDQTSNDFELTLPQGEYRPSGAPESLPMTGSGLMAWDTMTLRIRVDFPNANWTEGNTEYDVTITDAELLSDNDNYELETANGAAVILHQEARGKVELRSISTIEVVKAPDKLEYNYGETLDLTGLTVNISYTTGSEENTHTNTIMFRRADDFAANGLYVNYYPSSTLLQEDDGYTAWAQLRDKYYIADTGDHVTIAPTHGSMSEYLAQGDPKREFSANGKYLIITAQRDSKHEAAEPIIVTDFATKQPVQIKVNPRPITFRLEAEDKTYDGTAQAAGSIRFENVYQRLGYVDANNRDVTDMVYPVTGADYEELWGDKLTQSGDADFTRYVEQSGYRFSTGSYDGPQTDPLAENAAIQWTEGYAYAVPGTMTFSFLDPNVAYETAPGDHSYGTVTTKPVQVTGLRLAGADAANYTLATQVTTEDLAAGTYQGSALPTATIHKANRAPLRAGVPLRVEVDPGTNVVRTVYDQSLTAIAGGEQSQYTNELHLEYALQYSAPSDGETTSVIQQWAGPQGAQLWWDERYYGGEAVSLEYPEGYVPKEDDLPQAGESSGSGEQSKGQTYQWAGEDGRFVLDGTAYPDGSGTPWPGYDLYRTDRTALPRDTVYWPVVRVAETHNYYASPAISSVEGYTPAMIQAVLDAKAAVDRAAGIGEEELAAARQTLEEASAVALTAMAGAVNGALADANRESERLMEIAEEGKWPEDWTNRAPAAAVKTYAQSLELVSVEELEGAESASGEAGSAGTEKITYQVPTLEAVWFTDVQEYAEKKQMDAVVRNMDPVRYQDYTWDEEGSTSLFGQGEESLSLRGPLEVEITRKDAQGVESTQRLTVNENNRARIYVKLRSSSVSGSNPPVLEVRIESEDLNVKLGEEPVTLKVTILPSNALNRYVYWTSSDESVATVDKDGKVTFVGVGVAVITATSFNGVSDSIIVTVLPEEWQQETDAVGIFNVAMEEPFFLLDDGLFHPGWRMTRGEAAKLLFQFYVGDPDWTRSGPESYPDLTGEESYATAVRVLSGVGVFLGLPDGNFGGDQSITRAEFIVLLVRMLGLEVPDTTGQPHAFLDTGEEDTWAYSEIDAACRYPGLIQGVGEGYFAPTRPITRAEAVVFLNRLLRFSQAGEDPLIPRDVFETHWAREPIIRAVNQGIVPPEPETEEEKKRDSR